MRLLIKYPSRERPREFFAVLNKAQKNRMMDTTRFLVTLDSNDASMNNKATKGVMDNWGNLEYIFGDSEGKISAINRDMDRSGEWDVLLLLSDDMHPIVNGYDKIICNAMKEHFPDLDGVLWLNDGYTAQRLNTIVCIGREYYNRFGFIYNPAYKSLFADNEFTDLSVRSGRVHYIQRVLIEHRHPMNVRGVLMDNLYKRNDAYFYQDRRLYYFRKQL